MAEKKEPKDGYIFDYISGTEVKATPEEVEAVQVYSKILVEDYGYPKSHITTHPQHRVKVRPSDTKKEYPIDIAVFSNDKKTEDEIFIIVECIIMRIKELTIILILALFGLASCKQHGSTDNWEKFFQENYVNGTFVLKNMNTNEQLIYNKERSNEEFVPASTFKILNSMIALQESSIANINDTIKWDGINRSFDLWNKDQTMKSALPISCVWFYQELARRTGKEKMQEWIDKTNYGNKKIENKIDRFWLDGNLAISANEQIDFLEKLVRNELPFDKDIQETVKGIMISDSTQNYIIHSKTGWSQNIGWNVGYVETKDNVWIFALNIDMKNSSEGELRKTLTYDILKEQKIIE